MTAKLLAIQKVCSIIIELDHSKDCFIYPDNINIK